MKLVVCFALLSAFVYTEVEGRKCYTCGTGTAALNTSCKDKFDASKFTATTCAAGTCMKTKTKATGAVIRSCTTATDCVAGGDAIKITCCTNKDGCNSATSVATSVIAMLISAFTALYAF